MTLGPRQLLQQAALMTAVFASPVLCLCGCGDEQADSNRSVAVAPQDVSAASPEPVTKPVEDAPEQSTPQAVTPTQPTEQPVADPPNAKPFATLPDAVRLPVIALSKLGAEIEVGVGDRVISVDLDGKAVSAADLQNISELPDLKSLNLSNTGVTDDGLRQLQTLKKLKFLYLFGAKVTDTGVEHLLNFPRLEVLCLDQTEITDMGLKTLEELPRLEKLHVHSRAKITDAGLLSLRKHVRLFELRVGGPHITEPGLAELRMALPECNVVHDPQTEAKAE